MAMLWCPLDWASSSTADHRTITNSDTEQIPQIYSVKAFWSMFAAHLIGWWCVENDGIYLNSSEDEDRREMH